MNGRLICLISTAASADESYFCIGEHATGFAFSEKNKTWNTARYQEHKWVGKKSANPEYKWEIYEFGKNIPESACEQDFNDYGSFLCDVISQF